MAGKGNLANLRPFKPGHSGNPAGRAGVLPPEIRKERKKNQAALIQTMTEVFLLNDQELAKRVMDSETTQLQHAIFGLVAKAREGDVTAFRYAIELITGKIPESDHDSFTEEDLIILNRIKEMRLEELAKRGITVEDDLG